MEYFRGWHVNRQERQDKRAELVQGNPRRNRPAGRALRFSLRRRVQAPGQKKPTGLSAGGFQKLVSLHYGESVPSRCRGAADGQTSPRSVSYGRNADDRQLRLRHNVHLAAILYEIFPASKLLAIALGWADLSTTQQGEVQADRTASRPLTQRQVRELGRRLFRRAYRRRWRPRDGHVGRGSAAQAVCCLACRPSQTGFFSA